MHEGLAAEPSPWARKLELVYAPRAALQVPFKPLVGDVPQLEKGTALFTTPLEAGWVFPCWTLRERGVLVYGPPLDELGILTPPEAMADAVRAVAAQWLDNAEHDPTWLPWLREKGSHAFVVQTLCRLLYSLTTGEVASKPHALTWAVRTLPEPWAGFVRQTVEGQSEVLGDEMLRATLELIRYTQEAGKRVLEGSASRL